MTFDRRAYQRDWVRRKRSAPLARVNSGRTRCAVSVGGGACGGRLEVHLDAIGRTVVACPWCERKRRGICRDCSQPVAGRVGTALRCAGHRLEAKRAQERASEARYREERRARARKAYHANRERRARNLEYKRAWRLANREKVKAQKRRSALRQADHRKEYFAQYREAHREHYRRAARRRYYVHHPDAPRPASVPTRPASGKYATTGQRLCLGNDCRVVLTGRKKKCARCKARDIERAAVLLASRRVRRTDREGRVA